MRERYVLQRCLKRLRFKIVSNVEEKLDGRDEDHLAQGQPLMFPAFVFVLAEVHGN